MKKAFAVGLCLLGAGLLAGCETAGRPPAAPAPISVITPSSSSPGLDTGQNPAQMLQVTATVMNDSSNKGVTWTCTFTPSGGAAAACANFPSMSTGCSTCMATFTAPGSPGSVSITATSIADSTKSSPSALKFNVNPRPTFPAPAQVVSQLQASSPSCNASSPGGTVTLGPTAGTAYNCGFAAAFSGGTPPITWSATGLSQVGLTINSSTGVISGTPTGVTKLRSGGSLAGRLTASSDPMVTVTAMDSSPNMVLMPITIAINVALGFTNVAVPSSGTAGQPYMGNATVGGGTTPYHWTVSGLPNGLTSNAASATTTTTVTISGTPTQSGTFMLTISVTDSESPAVTVSATIMLTIAAPPPLTITTATLPTGDVNLPYNATLQATGGIPPDTWSAGAGTLPAGLMLSPDGHISGTPTMAGTFGFTVQVVDSETPPMMATKTFSLTINPPLTVTTTTLPEGTVGTAYTTTTLASSGGTPPVTWAVTTGTLPAGLMLTSATGAISGTPTTAGTSTFTVQAKDSLGQTATQSLSITIHPAPLSITTMILPSGTVNSPYNQTVLATGGTPPYTFSLPSSSGPLPTGLNLASTGMISGTPTATGTFNFTVQVTDSETPAMSASKQLSITINPANNNAKLSGDFALQFTGFADSGSRVGAGEVAVIGRFHADGNGNLTVGVLDFNTPNGSFAATTFTGTYSVTSDNRFTLTANLAPGGTFIARGVLLGTPVETRVGRIIEFDDSGGMAVRGSGEIHVQTLTDATFSRFFGDFALGFFGDITVTGLPNARLGVVGRFTLTNGAFSAGFVDVSVPGTSFSSSLPGQLSAPDATTGRGTGTVTITIPPPIAPTPTPLTLHIAYVVVGHHQAFVIVTDQRAPNVPLLSGFVQSQRQLTFSAASITGPLVFALAGMCGSPDTTTAQASVVVGQTVANGSGMFTSGMFDQNECGAINPMIPLTGTYTQDSTVKGRFTVSLIVNPTQAKPLMLYLYDNNKGFLLEGTSGPSGTPGTEVAFGIVIPQTIPVGGFTEASAAGTYGFATVAPASTNVPNESGVVTLTSNAPSTFAGTADISTSGTPFLTPDFALAGTYALANAAVGRFTAASTVPALPFSLVIYAVNTNGSVAIDVRPGNAASPGIFFEK